MLTYLVLSYGTTLLCFARHATQGKHWGRADILMVAAAPVVFPVLACIVIADPKSILR